MNLTITVPTGTTQAARKARVKETAARRRTRTAASSAA
jgi:hypothetical protein